MASQRVRSPLAPLLALAAVAYLACHLSGSAFLPVPSTAARASAAQVEGMSQAALTTALVAAAAPQPVMAFGSEEEEGFDMRILATLALPAGAISWALFNVWRVAFRQVARFSETASGNSKDGLRAED
ncbi:unnamed protein product [Polarella glacialis]|uniref:Photosystem II protein Y n=1 Tax=Polarella glacialis TaxID=89957 RepID=A0A813DM73_POLGL|nr:unnamed protein product [Polarella glacialis]CAE8597816.1 unnamed protein product [Polarella glacialis]CAE8676643.1 unnamed protein product [Polarella glacialis]CAE8724530.1 unnamed protein product [Polarella glacialis]